jgi:phage I-like protein
MAYKLTDVDTDEVSLVDKGAVPRKFVLIKRQVKKQDEEDDSGASTGSPPEEAQEETPEEKPLATKEDIENLRNDIKMLSDKLEALNIQKDSDMEEVLSYVKKTVKKLLKESK